MITAELRRVIAGATGAEDPLLRPGPAPGSYTTASADHTPPYMNVVWVMRIK